MTQEVLKLALEAFKRLKEDFDADQHEWEIADVAITAIKEALAQPEQEPKCGAIIEVFGKDWRLEYMSLPVGKHKLYTQQYIYTAPQPQMHPCAGRNCGSTNPNLHSAECFEDYEKATGMAQPKQEPVAYQDTAKPDELVSAEDWDNIDPMYQSFYRPLYTTPPQRTWVGLTDEEYIHITDSVYHQGHGLVAYHKAIEAKLKQKNGYAEEKNNAA